MPVGGPAQQGGEEFGDRRTRVGRVAQLLAGDDAVVVRAAAALVAQVPGLFEVGDDALHAAFGEQALGRDVPHPDAGVAGDLDQHAGMVGQEGPLPFGVRAVLHPSTLGRIFIGQIFHVMTGQIFHDRQNTTLNSCNG